MHDGTSRHIPSPDPSGSPATHPLTSIRVDGLPSVYGERCRGGAGNVGQVPTVVRRAHGLLFRVVREGAVVSLPGTAEQLVVGSGAAMLVALEEPASTDEIIDRFMEAGDTPADIDPHQVVLDAIAALTAAGMVEIETAGPEAPM